MKKLAFYKLLVFVTLLPVELSGQNPFTGNDSARIEQQVITEAEKLREKLFKTYNPEFYSSPEIKNYSIEFMIDTFKIERRLELQIDMDYSTAAMAGSTNLATANYDILLNKYYKILMDNLEDKDAKMVRESQRNWIAYRDTELKVQSNFIWMQVGGTMAIPMSSASSMYFTKTRVTEIFNYMLIAIENNYHF
jgi:uncharacterized protein YecT (DUF1311 family)